MKKPVKSFNTDHIRYISKLTSIISIDVLDVFIGDYFVAFLVKKKPDKLVIKTIRKIFDKKVFFYEFKSDPIDFMKQFSRGNFEVNGNNTIKIRIAKKFFYAMIWFLKRNYKNSNFTFKFN